MKRRQPKSNAERSYAYRIRHGLTQSVSIALLADLRREIAARKAKVATAGLNHPQTFSRLLELLSYIERELEPEAIIERRWRACPVPGAASRPQNDNDPPGDGSVPRI